MFMNKKLKLAPVTLKRYEPKLDTYFFYNVRSGLFWKTDLITGSVVAKLDGKYTTESLLKNISSESTDISEDELKDYFGEIFQFLIREGFICE